jgi:hypothetical protein
MLGQLVWTFFPVWVHILGLPLILWSKEVFEKIGNTLGTFYEANLSFQETGYYGMAQILVGLEVSKGLVESWILEGELIFSISIWTMKGYLLYAYVATIMGPCCRMQLSKYEEELGSKEASERSRDIGTRNNPDYK